MQQVKELSEHAQKKAREGSLHREERVFDVRVENLEKRMTVLEGKVKGQGEQTGMAVSNRESRPRDPMPIAGVSREPSRDGEGSGDADRRPMVCHWWKPTAAQEEKTESWNVLEALKEKRDRGAEMVEEPVTINWRKWALDHPDSPWIARFEQMERERWARDWMG